MDSFNMITHKLSIEGGLSDSLVNSFCRAVKRQAGPLGSGRYGALGDEGSENLVIHTLSFVGPLRLPPFLMVPSFWHSPVV